jgi:hypothetical protein
MVSTRYIEEYLWNKSSEPRWGAGLRRHRHSLLGSVQTITKFKFSSLSFCYKRGLGASSTLSHAGPIGLVNPFRPRDSYALLLGPRRSFVDSWPILGEVLSFRCKHRSAISDILPPKDTSRHKNTQKKKLRKIASWERKKQNSWPETAELKNHITALSALTKSSLRSLCCTTHYIDVITFNISNPFIQILAFCMFFLFI